MGNHAQENENMAKVPKSLFMDEELSRMVAAVEKHTGASFTRIMTAALLQYLFDGFHNPKSGKSSAPDPDRFWMSVVVSLERGETALADLADELLQRAINQCERAAKICSDDTDDEESLLERANWKQTIKAAQEERNTLEWDVEEQGDTMKAVISRLTR